MAASKGAQWLMQEQVKAGCMSGTGTFSSFIERDITGDGASDLILDHRDLKCAGSMSMSGFCGVQACSVLIYVRDGRLLRLSEEVLSVGVTIGKGNPPTIGLVAHGGRPSSIRWNGKAFE